MPATPTRMTSLAQSTRPEAFVPEMVKSAVEAAACFTKSRRVSLRMAGSGRVRGGASITRRTLYSHAGMLASLAHAVGSKLRMAGRRVAPPGADRLQHVHDALG